ncbi:MAG: nicotinate-nucleotide diphosphorylase (carboxylating) [Candidatus Binatia bacterium]|nr:MAG: nicotinate-nucleotide diphosphorylase (carboxylating) [Candidatus Binatia bacterium]
MSVPLFSPGTRALVRAALEEDLGRGDVTSELLVPPEAAIEGRIVAKAEGVLAGSFLLPLVFEEAGGGVRVVSVLGDGVRLRPGSVVARVEGRARTLLAGERVALNLLGHLSGIATLTSKFAERVAGTKAVVVDTRKTLPGLRALEKYAVRVGGGKNHRFGLDDGILVKENHVAVVGGVRRAVEMARARRPHLLRVEVECRTLAEVEEALGAGADAILLDNMGVADVRRAVELVAGRALVEASGGISLENVREVAAAGVDFVSVGALTHSAPALDFSMLLGVADA